MAEIKTWKKYQTIPFVDIRTTGDTPTWARIGKSTIFDLVLNANIETFDFIEDENPTDIIKNYKPTLSQELRTVEGDTAFTALYQMLYDLPTGDEAIKDVLLVFPKSTTDEGAIKFDAWKVPATIVLTNFNTVDEKILFDLNFAGTIARGTVTITAGKPTFTETVSE